MNRLDEIAPKYTDSLSDSIDRRIDNIKTTFGEQFGNLLPRLSGVLLGSTFVVSRVAAQNASICQQGNFFDRAFTFLLTAAGTFVVGAFAASQLIGGGGQAVALDSSKQTKFRSMQMGGIWGIIGAFAGLALLSIMIAWVAFPVDMSCFSGFGFGG